MKKVILLILLTVSLFAIGKKPCLDPFSTINWGFFFDDLLLGSYGDGDSNPVCLCSTTQNGVPDAGLKLRLTEPIGFLELVSEPGTFPCFMKDSSKGGIAKIKKRGTPKEYRNGHYYQYPVFALLNFGLDQLCVSQDVPLDLPFIGELNPLWYDDFTAAIVHPDSLLVANPIAQLACLWDCAASTLKHPSEFLSWCNGCWQGRRVGTGRPLGKNGPVDDAALAISILDFQHMGFMLPQTIEIPGSSTIPFAGEAVLRSSSDIACGKTINYFPKIIKSQYFLQISYPTVSEKIITPGESAMIWSNFKGVPTYQDRIFTLWRRKVCCVGVAHLLY